METDLNKMLQDAEEQHTKLVVLHAQITEQINKFTEENKKLIHVLTLSKGEIQGYRKALDLINKCKE
jgi:hypothetical protein